ncbi:MAG: undecaprenyl-diphosphate phosphatase, partial [Enterococcus sp.]
GNSFDLQSTIILITGTVVSFVVSVIAIKFLLGYIKKNDFTIFGWYRIILGVILIAYAFIAM